MVNGGYGIHLLLLDEFQSLLAQLILRPGRAGRRPLWRARDRLDTFGREPIFRVMVARVDVRVYINPVYKSTTWDKQIYRLFWLEADARISLDGGRQNDFLIT